MVFENLNRAIQSCRFQLACHCFFSEKVSVGAEIFAVVFFKIYKWLKKFQCAYRVPAGETGKSPYCFTNLLVPLPICRK